MAFLIALTVLAVAVAVGALQNGHAVTVSFLLWQFEAPLALIILGATVAGLVIGGLIGFARFVRRQSRARSVGRRSVDFDTDAHFVGSADS